MNSIYMVLRKVRSRASVLIQPPVDSPRITKKNVLHMIGNGVSVLVTIVTNRFNYIHTKEKVMLIKYM